MTFALRFTTISSHSGAVISEAVHTGHGYETVSAARKRLTAVNQYRDGDTFLDLTSLYVGVVRVVEIVPIAA